MRSVLELCALSLVLTATAAARPGFVADKPSTWKLAHKLGPGSELREKVIADWTLPGNARGEAPLTRAEAEKIIDDPRAQLVYADQTISIIAPSMLARQRKDHQDLLKIFLRPERIETAERFYRAHRAALARAQERHKVEPSVVVSILAFESNLGTTTGKYVAFNAFTSQAFFLEEANRIALRRKKEQNQIDEAKQRERVATIQERARRNLSALVRISKARGIDPLSMRSSWAGAIGYPQFLPATLEWAEDGNGDGTIDLYNFDDSIASVASYLAASGFSASRQKALWAYNHEQAYVDGVAAFADVLKKRIEASEADAGVASDGGPRADAQANAGQARDGGLGDR